MLGNCFFDFERFVVSWMRLLFEKSQPQMDVNARRWKRGLKTGIWSLELDGGVLDQARDGAEGEVL
jgi:hypothetical protein